MTTYPIGIDLDDRCLTAAQFRKTRKGLQLRGLFCQPLDLPADGDADGDASLVAALKTMQKSGNFQGRRAVLNLPFRDLSVFPVQFQLGGEEDPEAAILRESAKFLPYPLEEAMLDYPSFRRTPRSCYATVVAVRLQVMNRWLDILRRAGLAAEIMDISIAALIRLHRLFYSPADQADLLCHVGRHQSQMVVLSSEEILSLSEIPWGIHALTEKIQVHLDLRDDVNGATSLLTQYGLGYAEREGLPRPADDEPGPEEKDINMYRAIFQIIAPAIDGFVYECHKAVSYVRSIRENTSFGTVYLYGLAGLVALLDRYLEGQLGMPTERMDVITRLGLSDNDLLSCLPSDISPAPAIGLAMREVPWL